jgi:hypothetical protein
MSPLWSIHLSQARFEGSAGGSWGEREVMLRGVAAVRRTRLRGRKSVKMLRAIVMVVSVRGFATVYSLSWVEKKWFESWGLGTRGEYFQVSEFRREGRFGEIGAWLFVSGSFV